MPSAQLNRIASIATHQVLLGHKGIAANTFALDVVGVPLLDELLVGLKTCVELFHAGVVDKVAGAQRSGVGEPLLAVSGFTVDVEREERE